MNAKIAVELLNDTNYERWARDMMILLAGKGLTLIVEALETYPASSSTPASTSATGAGSSSITSSSSSCRSMETRTKEVATPLEKGKLLVKAAPEFTSTLTSQKE